MLQAYHDIKFLFIGPLILAMLVVINWMTSPGDWWVQWPALGMGIAWFICLLRVIRAAVIMGGLTALGVYYWRRRQAQPRSQPGPDPEMEIGR